MSMNADKLKLIKVLFFAMVAVDMFWGTLAVILPINILSFLSSTVTNTGQAILFLVVLDDYYGSSIQVLLKWVLVAIVGVIAVLFLLVGYIL